MGDLVRGARVSLVDVTSGLVRLVTHVPSVWSGRSSMGSHVHFVSPSHPCLSPNVPQDPLLRLVGASVGTVLAVRLLHLPLVPSGSGRESMGSQTHAPSSSHESLGHPPQLFSPQCADA